MQKHRNEKNLQIIVTFFVAAAVYLLLSYSVTAATTISQVVAGSSPETFPLKEDKVNNAVTVNPATQQVTVNLTNASVITIEKTLTYRCKSLGPEECVRQVVPDVTQKNSLTVYEWSQVADTTAPYPQTANILILVKLANGLSWIPFWETIVRSGPSSFSSTANTGVSQIESHPVIEYAPRIREFLDYSQVFPFSWLEKIMFSGTDRLLVLLSPLTGTPAFTPLTVPSAVFESFSLTEAYGIIFPLSGTVIRGPVTVYQNTGSFVPGNGNCELPDETPANSCADCACFEGSYCDTTRGCSPDSGVSATLTSTAPVSFTNCNVPHPFTIRVKVNNPPTGTSLLKANYTINGATADTSCTGNADGFICPATLQPIPGCSAGVYTLTPNKVSVTVSYPDGPRPVRIRSFTLPLPDLTIGSWGCGNGIAETATGESSANCCYDVSCAPASYCDGSPAAADKSASSCRTLLSSSDLSLGAPDPVSIPVYNQNGNPAAVTFTLASKPTELRILSRELTLSCLEGNTDLCEVTSSFSCTPVDSATYAERCSFLFTITGYENTKSYAVRPELRLQLTYPNATQNMTSTLTGAAANIRLGANYCGDRECQQNENSLNCCFDCVCDTGSYCDTETSQAPSATDQCKALDGITFTVLSITPNPPVFVDARAPHSLEVRGELRGRPAGMEDLRPVLVSCALSGSPIGCQTRCVFTPAGEQAVGVVCDVTVPAMVYADSPLYNTGTKEITFDQNSLTIPISFNNGAEHINKDIVVSLPQIKVGVTFHRNDGQCEAALGESAATSCADCPCEAGQAFGQGFYCFPGGQDRELGTEEAQSRCVDLKTLNAGVNKMEPESVVCELGRLDSATCLVLDNIIAEVRVANPPADLDIIGASYTFRGETYDTTCIAQSDPTQPDKREKFNCPMAIGELDSDRLDWPTVTEDGTVYRAPVTFTLPLSFTSTGGVPIIQTADVRAEVKVEVKKSDRVRTCEQQQQQVSDDMEKQDTISNTIKWILISMGVVVAGFCLCWLASSWFFGGAEPVCKYGCIVGSVVTACISSVLLPLLGSFKGKETELKSQYGLLCADINTPDLARDAGKMSGIWYTAGGAAAGVACAVGVWRLSSAQGLFGVTWKGAAAPAAEGGIAGDLQNSIDATKFPIQNPKINY